MYLDLCLSLWSKSLIPLSDFLESASFIFKNSTPYQSLEICQSLIKRLKSVEVSLQTDSEQFEIQKSSEPTTWELVIRIMSIISLARSQPTSAFQLEKSLEKLLSNICELSPSTISEFNLILHSLVELLTTFKENIESNASQLWEFLESFIFCSERCSSLFHLLDEESVKLAFDLIHLMIRYFENERASLFESLVNLFQSNENVNLFVTRIASASESSKIENNSLLRSSQLRLENIIMGPFFQMTSSDSALISKQKTSQIVQAGTLNSVENITCGLVNLGSTCYANSLLQQFANMPWFVSLILQHCAESNSFKYVKEITKGIFLIL